MNRLTAIISVLVALAISAGGCRKDNSPSGEASTQPANEPAEQVVPLSPPPAGTEAIAPARLAEAQRLINGGVRYLLATRDADGGWSIHGALKPAITAMVLKALVQHPDFDAESEVVARGFDVLLSYQRTDGADAGAIYNPPEGLANYTTAVAVMALAAADDPRHTAAMRRAVEFLKGQQIVAGSESPEGEAIDEAHPFYGGVSYDRHGRPDLSNVGMWAQALHDAGVSGEDPAFQRAAVFLTRTQNRSESNTLAWAAAGSNDGGFAYAPALAGDLTAGESKAGPGPGETGLRSYGSMTYVGFKSLLYAEVGRDDPRVRAAWDWIRTYWSLDSNPNMPAVQSLQGLYYYYHAFAKALRAWGQDVVTDAEGHEHNWRAELIQTLAARVGDDGSWVNDADRWQEGSPVLVTTYAVITLQETLKK